MTSRMLSRRWAAALALCTSFVCFDAAAAGDGTPTATDTVYAIHLPYRSDASPAERRAEQESILRKLQQDGRKVHVLGQATVLDNVIMLRTNADPAWVLADEAGVTVLNAASAAADTGAMKSDRRHVAEAYASAIDELTRLSSAPGSVRPFNTKADDGKVTVAIMSTGVDYTHTALGGSGKPEDYAAAWENRHWTWQAFPTDVVTLGRDFVGNAQIDDFYGEDHNPIEANFGPNGYEKGEGTAMASIVHRLAPDAGIMAVKMTDVARLQNEAVLARFISEGFFLFALEYVVDPNLDGDTSDRADIVVLPSYHAREIYPAVEATSDYPDVQASRLQAIGALGTLVITDVGDYPFGELGKYGLVSAAGAPDTLAVGYVAPGRETGAPVLARQSAHGPVGGSERIKPDLVAELIDDAVAVAGTGTTLEPRSGPTMAIATVAGQVARLMLQRPGLSPIEAKNLLVETADRNIVLLEDSNDSLIAEPTAAGTGLFNADRALGADLIAWEYGTFQPSLNFGMQEVSEKQVYARQLLVRNIGDSARTVGFSIEYRDAGDEHGLTWELPSPVTLPAGESRIVNLALTIDAAGLGEWPIRTGDDYTPENWRKAERDGYLVISDGSEEILNLAWMAKPRAASRLHKRFDTLVEYDFDSTPFGEGFGIEGVTTEYSIEVTNESATPTLYAALPAIYREPFAKPDRANTHYGQPHVTGGGIYPETACSGTGHKVVLGARMRHPLMVGFGFQWDTYTEDYVEQWDLRDGVEAWKFLARRDPDRGMTIMVIRDSQTGNPRTYYENFNVPNGDPERVKASTLPTYMSPHSQNVLAQVCVEDLFHHDFQALEDFDHDFGWVLRPGLWDYPDLYEPIIEHNLMLGGLVRPVRDWLGGLSLAKTGTRVGLRIPGPDETDARSVPAEAYSPLLEVGAGERFVVHAVRDYICPMCGEMLLMSLSDSNGLWSPTHYLDADGTPVPAIVDGQVFEVPENATAGTTVGNVRLDTPGLFAINPENFYADGGMYLMNSLPGDPFTVTRSGEIIVANPAALDYETSTGFQLALSMQDVLVFHGSVPVDVRLKNENDNAPVSVKALPALSAGQGVTVALSEYFTDPDGDPLSYTSGSLPSGLALDPATGMLAGVLPPGVTKIAFDVSDGEHSVAATLSAGTASPGKAGGGSFGLWLLALPLLAGWRRRGHAV